MQGPFPKPFYAVGARRDPRLMQATCPGERVDDHIEQRDSK
jgi:hypothetical protein